MTTSGLAVACLVLGLLSFILGPFSAIPALFCGHRALAKIRAADGGLRGNGMAKAGLAVSYAVLALWGAFIYHKTMGGA